MKKHEAGKTDRRTDNVLQPQQLPPFRNDAQRWCGTVTPAKLSSLGFPRKKQQKGVGAPLTHSTASVQWVSASSSPTFLFMTSVPTSLPTSPVTRWCSWWRAASPPCCVSPWRPSAASRCCRSGTWTPACRPSGSSPTGRRRWPGSQRSCCRRGSVRWSAARRRPGSAGRSRTPPTGRRCDAGARRGRRPPPPPGPSEPSGSHESGGGRRVL